MGGEGKRPRRLGGPQRAPHAVPPHASAGERDRRGPSVVNVPDLCAMPDSRSCHFPSSAGYARDSQAGNDKAAPQRRAPAPVAQLFQCSWGLAGAACLGSYHPSSSAHLLYLLQWRQITPGPSSREAHECPPPEHRAGPLHRSAAQGAVPQAPPAPANSRRGTAGVLALRNGLANGPNGRPGAREGPGPAASAGAGGLGDLRQRLCSPWQARQRRLPAPAGVGGGRWLWCRHRGFAGPACP